MIRLCEIFTWRSAAVAVQKCSSRRIVEIGVIRLAHAVGVIYQVAFRCGGTPVIYLYQAIDEFQFFAADF